jgi:hypothetical protein
MILARSLSVGLAAFLAVQSYPPAFPRPNVTPLAETSRFAVWDIVWPKGQPTGMHRHVYDQVGTYYQPGDRRITNLDGSVRSASTQIGALSNTRKGTTHIEEGISDVPLRAVFIELKEDGPSGAATVSSDRPPMFPRPGATKVQDDERVAVWDYTWTPSAGAFQFQTRHDTVIVALSGGRIRGGRPGAEAVVDLKPGTARVLPRGAIESETLVDGQPRMMVFEIK